MRLTFHGKRYYVVRAQRAHSAIAAAVLVGYARRPDVPGKKREVAMSYGEFNYLIMIQLWNVTGWCEEGDSSLGM